MKRLLLAMVLLGAPVVTHAQTSASAAAVGELVKLLDQMKLDSVAAAHNDGFVAALYFPGSQLLVVRGTFSSPERARLLINGKMYRDVYIDLNSAADTKSKVFISDLGVNGLQYSRETNQPFDTVDMDGKSYSFDGDWGRARLSRDDYTKAYQDADARYTQMLQALLQGLRKTS